jgi:hypothetical protein
MTTPKKKNWCPHIVWRESIDDFTNNVDFRAFTGAYQITPSVYQFCPICGKERPKG